MCVEPTAAPPQELLSPTASGSKSMSRKCTSPTHRVAPVDLHLMLRILTLE